MKKEILLFLALVLITVLFFLKGKDVPRSNDTPNAKVSSHPLIDKTSLPQKQILRMNENTMVSNDQTKVALDPIKPSSFLDKQDLSILINDVENQMDSQRAYQVFKQIDTLENFKRAIHVLSQSYDQTTDWKLITKERVLALHFLGWTSQMNKEFCETLINQQINFYKEGTQKQQWATVWDLLALGKICVKMDKGHYLNLISKLPLGKSRTQLELAVPLN